MSRSESSASPASGPRRPLGPFAWLVAFGLSAVLLAGCGAGGDEAEAALDTASEVEATDEPREPVEDEDGPADTPEAPDPEPDPDGEGSDDFEAFCAAAEPTQRAVDREFIGSDAHVEMMDTLRSVAPDEIVEDLVALVDHFEHHVDPSNPDSQDFPNWSPAVQDTALRVQSYVAENC